MVQGHSYVKMATSVIDYVFRDLAISYLKRGDLGQVKPEDLQATAAGEEVTPLPAGIAGGGSGPGDDAGEGGKIAQARLRGYEGDPCPACGSFTLVRSGTCMKCDTCGGTTGCS
jgi:ribonucleoside-diphosphate reductase alpha chain